MNPVVVAGAAVVVFLLPGRQVSVTPWYVRMMTRLRDARPPCYGQAEGAMPDRHDGDGAQAHRSWLYLPNQLCGSKH